MATIVITGANRGIGLSLAQLYIERGDSVIALCRNPGQASALDALSQLSSGRLVVGQIDISDAASVQAAADRVGQPVDVLINNAGILGGENQTIADIRLDEWEHAFRVMTIGPFLVTRALLPQLEAARGKIAIISSQVASSTWPYGGLYGYATSKAASIRLAQILAIDLRPHGITTVAIHPGYVKTEMSGPTADISPEESASGIVMTLDKLTSERSGQFLKWNGEEHAL